MKKAYKEIINPDKIGYMEKRFCGENTRLIADIIEYCRLHKQQGILLFVNFEKAFDTVKWDFLFEVLHKFNFGNVFIVWIKIIYTGIYSKVTNNG